MIRMLVLLVMASVLAISPAHAGALLGVKIGAMSVGFDDASSDEDPVNAGLLLAYEKPLSAGILAFELEVTRTIAAGGVADQDLEVDSQGIYVSFASSGASYIKGRLGLMDASLSAGVLSEDEGGETYGLALGYRASSFRVELDYTSIDDDVAFISLGFVYPF